MLWYRSPADKWLEALPIGNGRLGAMVFGGIDDDVLDLHESTCWSGEPSLDNCNPEGPAKIPIIQDLLFKGEYEKATEIAQRIVGRNLNYGTHLPFGKLVFSHRPGGHTYTVNDYRFELDLSKAVASIEFECRKVNYRREFFCSNPDQVMVARFSASHAARITFEMLFLSTWKPASVRSENGDTLIIDGKARETIHSDGKTGVDLHGRIKAVVRGGSIVAGEDRLFFQGADEVTLFIALGTTFNGNDPAAACKKQLEAAVLRQEKLYQRHTADHRALFERVGLDLGATDVSLLPTDERIAAVQNSGADPALPALFFQYARYLLIAASRENSPLPTHLQGVWNDFKACRIGWTCDYHLDINTQMNYWIAEVGNLSECHEALMRWVENKLMPSGRHTAKVFYDASGWVAHIFSNAWGFSAPGQATSWGFHPTGGVWVALHLWQHFQFCLDYDFLAARAYPVLKEAAEFFLDYMVVHPEYGWLVSGPSCSPENAYVHNGKPAHLTMGPTCDRVLIFELFKSCIEATEILDCDEKMRIQLKEAFSRLSPLQTGKYGQLREWLEDHEEIEPFHRHTSHLLALYPFDQITPTETGALAAAAEVSVMRRKSHEKWNGGTFAQANMILHFARLGEAEKAYDCLHELFMNPNQLGANLFVLLHTVFEMDGNTGPAAGIAEMLLQSHSNEIRLLPALPDEWPEGRVKGLRAKGGFVIDMSWEKGTLIEAEFYSRCGAPFRLRSGDSVVVSCDGETECLYTPKKGIIEIDTKKDRRYKIAVHGN